MKRWFALALAVLCVLLSGCSNEKPFLAGYSKSEEHHGGAFVDFTDYCKYYYDVESVKAFAERDDFQIVTDSDIEEIRGYFDNIESWVEEEDFADQYDFDAQTQIKVGDYFRIETKEGQPIGQTGRYDKYDSYNVYYVDMEKCIVYFVHSNI